MDTQTGNNLNELALKINRLDRMLKWLIIKSTLTNEMGWQIREQQTQRNNRIQKSLPDISDILSEYMEEK